MSTLSPATDSAKLSAHPRTPLAIAGIALALGLAVEVLFHGHRIGISFPIWAALGFGAILLAARVEGVRPSPATLALIPAILFFAAVAAYRLEPMTVVLSMLATLLLFGLFVRTLMHGRLHRFGFIDFLLTWISVPLESIARPWPTLSVASRQVTGDRVARSRLTAVFRGLLLAFPVLVVFVALLATADLVFGDLVEDLLAWIDLERIIEYIGRTLVVLLTGVFFLGALVTALRARQPNELVGEERPVMRPFVGHIEWTVVLSAVVLVFAVFGAIQFRYLFGGEASITAAGYTYSEYARRGFGELVWAAALSLSLIFGLAHWGHRGGARQRWTFIGLSTALVLMLGVALASALQRLLLYERAFGFTRLRTYTHVFIFWLAALLIGFLVLLYLDRLRMFAPAAGAVALGFVATLSLVNVDGFISARNLDRYEASQDLDVYYLAQLTADANPTLARWVGETDAEVPTELNALLACEAGILGTELRSESWQSFHIGRQLAWSALAAIGSQLQGHSVWMDGMTWFVADPDGEETICLGRFVD